MGAELHIQIDLKNSGKIVSLITEQQLNDFILLWFRNIPIKGCFIIATPDHNIKTGINLDEVVSFSTYYQL